MAIRVPRRAQLIGTPIAIAALPAAIPQLAIAAPAEPTWDVLYGRWESSIDRVLDMMDEIGRVLGPDVTT